MSEFSVSAEGGGAEEGGAPPSPLPLLPLLPPSTASPGGAEARFQSRTPRRRCQLRASSAPCTLRATVWGSAALPPSFPPPSAPPSAPIDVAHADAAENEGGGVVPPLPLHARSVTVGAAEGGGGCSQPLGGAATPSTAASVATGAKASVDARAASRRGGSCKGRVENCSGAAPPVCAAAAARTQQCTPLHRC